MQRTLVFAAVLVAVAMGQMTNYGDPMTQYEPQAFLETNAYCGSGKCTYDSGSLPANQPARRVLTVFNSARTDPQYWRALFESEPNFNDILKGAKGVPPIHSWYTLALTAQSQADAVVQFSPSTCTPPDATQAERCGWDQAFFDANQLSSVTDQTCEPNLQPTDTTYTVCCFRLADCENSLLQHAQRTVLDGFPWSDCGQYLKELDIKKGEKYCGGQAGYISANTGDEWNTVKSWICDDTDLDNICNVDCTSPDKDSQCPNANDQTAPGAPGRLNLIDFQQLVGGGGFRSCGSCEFSDYWTLSSGFFTMDEFRPTYPIATAEYLPNGPSGQSGFMLSYWNVDPNKYAVGGAVYVYTYVTDASDAAVTQLSILAQGPTYWAAQTLPAGSCTKYFFAVINDDKETLLRTGYKVARYPENGNFQYGNCAADADNYIPVNGASSCDDGSNKCEAGGVCFDGSTCFGFGTTTQCTAAAPCAKVSGAASVIASIVAVAACVLLVL